MHDHIDAVLANEDISSNSKHAEDASKRREKLRHEWAGEMSEICQGLAVARLIFNTHRSEDVEIHKLLMEALELREIMQLPDKMAETLNSLGMLKQKQKVCLEKEKARG